MQNPMHLHGSGTVVRNDLGGHEKATEVSWEKVYLRREGKNWGMEVRRAQDEYWLRDLNAVCLGAGCSRSLFSFLICEMKLFRLAC